MLKPSISSNVSKKTILYIVLLGLLVSTLIGILGQSGALPLYYVDNLFYDALIRTQASGRTLTGFEPFLLTKTEPESARREVY